MRHGDGLEFLEVDAAEARADARNRTRTMILGGLVIVLVAVVVGAVSYYSLRSERAQVGADLRQRLEILVAGRSELIASWLEATARQTDRVVDSELFRLFAAELDLADGDLSRLVAPAGPGVANPNRPAASPLAPQIPYLNQALANLVRTTDFVSAAMVGRDGKVALAGSAGMVLADAHRAAVAAVFRTGTPTFTPAREDTTGLVMDYLAPVFPPQPVAAEKAVVAVFVFTLPVGRPLQEFLRSDPVIQGPGTFHIVQVNGARFEDLDPARAPAVTEVDLGGLIAGDGTIPFVERQGVVEAKPVYAAAAMPAGIDWWVTWEVEKAQAEAGLRSFTANLVALASLVVIVFLAAFAAFWWRFRNEYNRSLARQFSRMAGSINAQRRFLDSINNSIADYIGLQDESGKYVYVNPAFASAAGRSAEEMIGLDDEAVFGHGTAQRLRNWDKTVATSGRSATAHEEVYLAGKRRHLQVSKIPFRGEEGSVSGILSVARDITDLVEHQRKRERAVRQTVNGLVRAVELRDPHLAGHSARMAGFAITVATNLNAPAELVTTVEIAANLSQIGKLGVRRELLTKTERLSLKEITEMERHVEFAQQVLRDIDFGVPVTEAIYQMYERLDGKGYPQGLSGDEIGLAGRILAVCDVFCARIEPRSYRGAIAPEEALKILKGNPSRYDMAVVRALGELMGSVAGEKLLAGVAPAA